MFYVGTGGGERSELRFVMSRWSSYGVLPKRRACMALARSFLIRRLFRRSRSCSDPPRQPARHITLLVAQHTLHLHRRHVRPRWIPALSIAPSLHRPLRPCALRVMHLNYHPSMWHAPTISVTVNAPKARPLRTAFPDIASCHCRRLFSFATGH